MKNKKNIIWIIAILLIIVALFIGGMLSRKPKKEEPKKEEETKEFSYMPLTYKICDDNSCIHIAGSFHIGDKRITKLDQKILDIYKNSDYLALEVDEEEGDITQDLFLLDGGKTIEDLMSAEDYAKIDAFSKEHPMYILGTLKYYNLGFNLDYVALLPFIEKKYLTYGMDSYFQKEAKKDGKEIIPFETVKQQLDLLMGYSNEFYLKSLLDLIDNYEESEKLQDELYEAYLAADRDKMVKLIEEDLESDLEDEPTQEELEFFDAMYTSRNENMTNMIKEFLSEDKNVFVIVGEAHVIPEGGILDALSKDSQYTITRVK